ncbi:hypothetical protein T492DRAFT_847021 [Pavlovales sp. CCMP2436]|nr:hypothetical protein T492DRAFT_847021 [Pavlovales sp. CCMP2436]
MKAPSWHRAMAWAAASRKLACKTTFKLHYDLNDPLSTGGVLAPQYPAPDHDKAGEQMTCCVDLSKESEFTAVVARAPLAVAEHFALAATKLEGRWGRGGWDGGCLISRVVNAPMPFIGDRLISTPLRAAPLESMIAGTAGAASATRNTNIVVECIVEKRIVEERIVEERIVEERIVEERIVEERIVEERIVEERIVEKRIVEERIVERTGQRALSRSDRRGLRNDTADKPEG